MDMGLCQSRPQHGVLQAMEIILVYVSNQTARYLGAGKNFLGVLYDTDCAKI